MIYAILFTQLRKTVFPFGFQIESSGFERIRLLFDAFFDHLPETIAHSIAEISRRRLSRFEIALSSMDGASVENAFQRSILPK